MNQLVVVPLLAAAVLVAGTPAARAQAPAATPDPSLQVTTPAPAPHPGIRLEPTMPLEERAIREQEFYPGMVYGRHEPAFVIPFVTNVATSPTSSMRVGFSAWTAPALPFDITEATAAPAVGLTIIWGGPPVETRPPDRPVETR